MTDVDHETPREALASMRAVPRGPRTASGRQTTPTRPPSPIHAMSEDDDYLPTLVGGVPAPGDDPAPLLLHFQTGSRAGTSEEIAGTTSVLGRASGCDVRLATGTDGLVSGKHLRFSREDDAWWAEDLGSTNGTMVNGRPISARTRLSDGDTISLGPAGQPGSVGLRVELAGSSSAVVPGATGDEPPTGEGDFFDYRCPSCQATCSAAMSSIGLPATCAACGGTAPVPLPPVNPFARLRPRSGTSAPTEAPAPGAGIFSRLKGGLRGIKQRRELQQELTGLEEELLVTQRVTGTAAEALGRAAWDASLAEAMACPAGEGLRDLEAERARLDREIGESEAALEAHDEEEVAAAATAEQRLAPLEESAESARAALEESENRLAEAEEAVRTLLAGPLADLARTCRSALELAEVDDPAKIAEPEEDLREVAGDLTAWCESTPAVLEELAVLRAATRTAGEALEAARATEAAARASLDEARSAEVERAEAARGARAERERALAEARRQHAALDGRLRPLLVGLGRELGAAGSAAHIESQPEVVAALAKEAELERAIAATRAQLQAI